MGANKPAKPGETRGNRSKERREPIGADGERHPTEKQLAARKHLREVARYDYDNDISNIIAQMCKVATLQTIDTNNVEEVERNFSSYIKICADGNLKPTAEGLALSIGISRTSLQRWISGKVKKPPEVVAVCKKYMTVLNALHIQYMEENKINPIPAIFIAKNNFEDYRDQQDFKFSAERIEESTTDQLAEKYKEAMAIDITDEVEEV